jgi:hypothetical protein
MYDPKFGDLASTLGSGIGCRCPIHDDLAYGVSPSWIPSIRRL